MGLCPIHAFRYTVVEVACVTSHLRTIDLAFKNGDELALITEDDVTIPTNIGTLIIDLLKKYGNFDIGFWF